MLLVSARIMKIDLPMLDDGIVPIRHVNGTIRSHGDIHRPGRYMIRTYYILSLLDYKPAHLLLHGKSVNSVGTEIIGDKIPLPGFRQMPSRNDIQTAMFWLSGIQPSNNPLGTWCCHECSAGKSIVDSLSPCPIGQERLAPTVKLQAPRIDQTLSINFQLIILRSQLPNPASFKPPHSPGSFYVAIDIDGLVKIQQPLWAQTESMEHMVGD